MVTGVGAGVKEGRINWEIGINIYALLYIKQVTNKDLLHSTGNSIQYPNNDLIDFPMGNTLIDFPYGKSKKKI